MEVGNNSKLVSPQNENVETEIQTSRRLEVDQGEDECHTEDLYDDGGLVECPNPFEDTSKDLIHSKVSKEWIPEVGMEFDSELAAYKFYSRYAGAVGFNVRRDSAHRNKDGAFRDRVFCCSCQGQRQPDKREKDMRNHRPVTRFGCLAKMKIVLQKNEKLRVTQFLQDHSHKTEPPSKAHLFKLQRNSSVAHAAEANLTNESGAAPTAILEGTIDLYQMDYKNYLHSKRMIQMRVGDTGGVLKYLQQMQLEDPPFFYAIQVDEDDLMTNIFWADSRMVLDYAHFGDVVCLDTTCRNTKDCRPFALFFGVNHHKKIVIFGVAVLYDESIDTFSWLFDTFFKAMSGKRPKTILTDQDASVAKAISTQLPETYHRLCVWQVHQNAIKLLKPFRTSNTFAKDFSNCMYDHDDEEDFLNAWNLLFERYEFHPSEKEWLQRLFEIKEKWALVYGRESFCGDITSAQQSESISKRLKEYVSYKHHMLQSFWNFQRLMEKRRYEELKDDLRANRSTPTLAFSVETLKHAARLYTPEIFENFQYQIGQTWSYDLHKCGEVGTVTEYKLIHHEKQNQYIVTFDASEDTVVCSCKKFEFVGILFSHALKVLGCRNFRRVPPRYILKRWTKGAKAGVVGVTNGLTTRGDPKVEFGRRYKDLLQICVQLASKSAESEERYVVAVSCVEKAIKVMEGMGYKAVQKPSTGSTDDAESVCDLNRAVPVEGIDVSVDCIERTHSDDDSNTEAPIIVTSMKTKEIGASGSNKRPKNSADKTPRGNITMNEPTSVPSSTHSVPCFPVECYSSSLPPPTQFIQGLHGFKANLSSGHYIIGTSYPPSMTPFIQPSDPNIVYHQNNSGAVYHQSNQSTD
ncbi:protein FAR1-RELATED SEQUENCE 5-like [Telopea speciosissima]|uniref:protein FAR1-RELATED SEQUENCE 5-like n=1 Tax=Telopea speciosissima TaxID=54955 RepID=UPI001CC7C159|nr:protein FAR1-RELATED SEQUENCE 5-like [Telopea speciosissima]XP_043716328.1 protein FAR1-RELATED SEQUENCE 5-like [Telopea speciosissima]XP_043716329.1 protein FAR1-RELATED SEQUENCE 5-like [Telopea speciosissima]XP_043716330.1 protein FAR1-RELATED SEQUENCE 5-like [Telopea speciosissima]